MGRHLDQEGPWICGVGGAAKVAGWLISAREVAGTTGLEAVGGALDAVGAADGDVCVDHGGLQVAVAEELLDGSDVGSGFEEVGGEGVAEGVGRDVLVKAGGDGGLPDGALGRGFVKVVPPQFANARAGGEPGSRETRARAPCR